jgi:uncharacterized repeat protein (TIGR01451 family)
VSKTASASTFVAGEQVTYTITVTNNSAGPAQNVQLTDLLPAETALQSVTTSSTFTLSPNPAQNGFTASSTSLAGGATATFTAIAKISPSQGSGSISNTASVTASNPDPNTGNNTATSTVTVTPLLTDLAITKTAWPASVSPGGTITYTLTVQNTGNGTAENLAITDVLPAGTTLLSVVTPGGSSVSAPPLGQNGTLLWQTPMLANGASVVYSATVQVDPQFSGTTVTNTATVTSTTQDPDPSNNSATAVTATCPNINVSIPNAFALPAGVQPNTVYIGYAPASTILLTATISGGTAPYQYSWSTGSHDASISVSPTATTTYSVTVTDANGCPSNSASITINVVDVRSGKNLNKVVICHKKKNTLSIDPTSVADHLGHGDQLGTCSLPATTVRRTGEKQDHPGLSMTTTLINYPNPFSRSTRIQYEVPANADVSLRLFDVTGREVQTIFSGKQAAGVYNIDYNTNNLQSGVYFCQLVAITNETQFRQIYKMIKSK